MLPKQERIFSKKQMKEWLNYELSRYNYKWWKALLVYGEGYIIGKYHILLRRYEYYLNTNKKIREKFYLLRLLRFQNKYSLHIPANCCSKGLRIMHLGPILINKNSVVGENCSFHINTALVAGGTNDYAPTLGKGIVVGVGAVILGGVHIADYTAIGANAVVNKDVTEKNIAVAGVPAKKISDNGALEWNKKKAREKF